MEAPHGFSSGLSQRGCTLCGLHTCNPLVHDQFAVCCSLPPSTTCWRTCSARRSTTTGWVPAAGASAHLAQGPARAATSTPPGHLAPVPAKAVANSAARESSSSLDHAAHARPEGTAQGCGGPLPTCLPPLQGLRAIKSVLVVAGGLLRSQEGQDEQDVLFRALR